MKTKVILTLFLVFVLGLVFSANAQLRAGSPEAKAFDKIEAETNADARAVLLLDFEKQFPQSPVLTDVYLMLIDIYRTKNDQVKVADFGEKAIKIQPDNVTALLAVSRTYAMERKNLDRAVQYAQRAVDQVAKLKAQPPPPAYSEEQWKAYVDSTEQSAKSLLSYAKSVKP